MAHVSHQLRSPALQEATFLRLNELLSFLVPAIVFFGIWFYVVRSMGSPNP